MPLYDYRCVNCGDFREFRPMTESNKSRQCPVCGASSEKVIGAPFLAGNGPIDSSAQQRSGNSGIRRACGHGYGCTHSHG